MRRGSGPATRIGDTEMKKHRPVFQGMLLLTACLVPLFAGLRSGSADQKPDSARQVVARWKHPDAQANSGATGAAQDSVFGETFRVPRPFKEVWQFYAKKCGYVGTFPSGNPTLAVSTSGSCFMMYENSTASGGGVSSAFAYRENGTSISVTLVDRKDGVRVFVSAGVK
jgi:hypothetical protein